VNARTQIRGLVRHRSGTIIDDAAENSRFGERLVVERVAVELRVRLRRTHPGASVGIPIA